MVEQGDLCKDLAIFRIAICSLMFLIRLFLSGEEDSDDDDYEDDDMDIWRDVCENGSRPC